MQVQIICHEIPASFSFIYATLTAGFTQQHHFVNLTRLFTTGDLYDHQDATGFITLFGLPLKVRAMKMAEVEK